MSEFVQKPHVKLTAAVTVIFLTTLVPIHFFPTFSKLTHITLLAGATAGWSVFFSRRYDKPPVGNMLV
jgi:hypothetical protein